jgi:methylated-DNA-[protein]-cysteine S-methyltransferase
MSESIRFFLGNLTTPIGRLTWVVDDQGRLRAAGFTDGHPRMERALRAFSIGPAALLVSQSETRDATEAFESYFSGDFAAIDRLPLFAEGSEFQRRVWSALREIPSGETSSYGELARRIRNPKAVRAVGLANGANPIAIVVPCHRVIGADGSLTGYGGGLERKRWLLAHERPSLFSRQLAM